MDWYFIVTDSNYRKPVPQHIQLLRHNKDPLKNGNNLTVVRLQLCTSVYVPNLVEASDMMIGIFLFFFAAENHY